MATMMDAPVSVTSSPSGGSRLTQMQVSGFSFPLRYKAVIWFIFPLSVETMVRTFKYHVADYKSVEIETIKEKVKLSGVTKYCRS
jgi:uncharacterized protein YqhQ